MFSFLPTELLYKIFDYLNVDDLYEIKLTCSQHNNIADVIIHQRKTFITNIICPQSEQVKSLLNKHWKCYLNIHYNYECSKTRYVVYYYLKKYFSQDNPWYSFLKYELFRIIQNHKKYNLVHPTFPRYFIKRLSDHYDINIDFQYYNYFSNIPSLNHMYDAIFNVF